MSGKTKEMYIDMINMLKDVADGLNLTLNPSCIMIDFEKGAIQASKRYSPTAKISGCHFHFCSAIFKKISCLGLKRTTRHIRI